MTRNEMIQNLDELSQYLIEEVQYANHAHERKMFSSWRSAVEEIRQNLVIERQKEETHLEGWTIGEIRVDCTDGRQIHD